MVARMPVTFSLAGLAAGVTLVTSLADLDTPIALWPLDHGFAGIPAVAHLA